ncbi:MAG: FHA domain-containing protein [Bacteroidales bacterium]|nr:FHA domain-containing protein [Bacteroidales bacterium]MDY2917222.1 FHA domain-containing protein [Muribaculaceae bacterium]
MIKLQRPAKSGVYSVTCPHCGVKKNLKIKGLDAMEAAPEQEGAGQQQAEGGSAAAGNGSEKGAEKGADSGVPDNSAKAPVSLGEDFLTDTEYTVACPHCQMKIALGASDKEGTKNFRCPRCKGPLTMFVRKPTVVLDKTGVLTRGKLVLLRRGWLNKDYPLSPGSCVIGRYDEDEVSDIAIKNDSTVSRRSVKIEVNYTSSGNTFKLTVLKSTNPVLLNGNALAKGEAVSLNFGDIITMGKTRFRFDRDE